MLSLIISLIITTVIADDFRLAAVAITSKLGTGTAGSSECIKTTGDIEYWVNMASQAKQATKIVASGGLQMNSLEVKGTFTLGDSTKNDNEIKGATKFIDDVLLPEGDLTLKLHDWDDNGVRQEPRLQTLLSKIDALESKISKLCQASKKDGGPNVCDL